MSQVAELQANPARPGVGTVIEAYMDKARGATATMLVQAGTLRQGDVVLAGAHYGKVRFLPAQPARTIMAGPYFFRRATVLAPNTTF